MKNTTALSSLCLALALPWVLPTPAGAQTFTTNYTSAGTFTFTVPSGVTQMIVQAWGAGGGGNDSSGSGERPGGGGGAFAQSTLSVTSGASYTVVVGLGGGSGNPATNGGPSFVRIGTTTNVLAAGGGGATTTSTPGTGGTVANSIGTIRFAGGSSVDGVTDTGGGGGGSAFTNANGNVGTVPTGGTGTGNGGNGGTLGNPGQDGFAPGGGGGGRGQDGVTSGDGAAGRVTIIYSQLSASAPAALDFSSSPLSVIVSNVSGLMTIRVEDTNGIPAIATNNVTVNLSSSLSGTFRNAADTANITSVIISNGQTSASFRYIPTVLGSHLLTAAASGLTSATQTLTSVAQPTIVQTYFVPFSEEDMSAGLAGVNAPDLDLTNVALISISAFASNTIIYWDHWEDGYEADLGNPTQSTTRIWGDGNIANGCPPNFTNPVTCTVTGDIIRRGQAVVSIETMPVPRNPANIQFDGRDRIGVTRPVAVTRFGWDVGPATLLAGAVEVYDTSAHGQRFQLPLGTNVVSFANAFQWTLVSVMPTRSNATIVVDFDNNGTPDLVTNIAVGATLALTNRVNAGTVVTSSAPVQVTMITGEIGSNYECRWYNIPPTESWSSEYLNPVAAVPSASGYGDVDVVLFNPNTNAITVFRQYKTPAEDIITDTKTIPGGTFTIVTNNVLNTAQYYYTTNGQPFFGLGFVNASNSGSASDWGYSLVPEGFLTPVVLVGSAPGRDPFSTTFPNTNVSPVWVTAGSPDTTTLYVDFNGNGGAFTNECGEYDTTIELAYLDSIRIYDPDGDQTAMKLFTCDGTLITAAWGQDPEIAPGAQPSLDMGYTVLPLPSIQADKEVEFAPEGDLNIDSVLNPGEVIRYSIIITNPNDTVSGGVTVQDFLPAEVIYSNNSTFLDGAIPIADSGTTPFPLDEGGYFLGVLQPKQARTITFDAQVIDPYTSPNTVITNRAQVFDDVSTIVLATEVSVPVTVPTLGIDKQSDVVNFVTNGQVITYTVTVANTSSVSQIDVQVTDVVPSNTTYVPGTVQVTAPVEAGTLVTNTVRDDFSSASYSLNTGTANWSGNWIEEGEATSPSAGVIQIVNGRLRLTNTNNIDPGIYRVANIANPIEATLSVRYEASNNLEVIDSVHVEISTNSGASYIVLKDYTQFSGSQSGIDNFDITPFATANTRVRVKIHEGYTGVDEFFRVDWIQIQYTTGISVRVTNTFAGGSPPLLHSNQTLRAGESMSITFQVQASNNLAGVTSIVNQACVTAAGFSVPFCDTVTDPVQLPAGLDLVKTVSPGSPGPYPGTDLELGTNNTPVTYWFVVSNTGLVPLANTTLTDPDLGFSTNFGTLAIGQSVTASFDSVISGDLTNIAGAAGTYLGGVYSNADDAVVLEINPAINVEKTVSDDGTFPGGELVFGTNGTPVTYWVVASNPGDVTLTNVVLTDLDVGYQSAPFDLAPGQSTTISVFDVISADLTNVVTITGEDPVGGVHTDEDPAEVDLIGPGIDVTKTVADDGAYPGVKTLQGTNDTALTYWFLLVNEGDVALTNVTLVDDDIPFTTNLGTLAVGQSITVSVADVLSADLTNVVVGSGQGPDNKTYSDFDFAIVDVINPAIAVAKTVSDDGSYATTELVTGTNNQPVTYWVVVSNTGDSTLTNVTLVDIDVPFTNVVGTLAAGQSVTVSVADVISADLTNTVIATGEDPLGNTYQDDDIAEVALIAPAITLAKTVSPDGSFASGGELVTGTNNQPVTYFFVIGNAGDVTLTNVVVVDADIPFTTNVGSLAVGQSVTVAVNDVISAALTNLATATGEDPLGNPHEDDDTAEVAIIAPAITLAKTVSSEGTFESSFEQVIGTNNQPVTYFMVVANAGDVALTNVVIDDPDIPFTTNVGDLAVGQSVTVSVNDVISADLTNTATATGEDPLGNPHEDDDIAEVIEINPGIALAKTVSADGTFASGGELVTGTNDQPVTYFFVISNTGDVTLTDVVLDDPDLPFNTNVGSLVSGQSLTVSVNDVISADLTNLATVTGQDPLNNPHTDDDTAEVALINPAINIEKTVSASNFANSGELVTGTNGQAVVYFFVVSNVGDVTLTNVLLSDVTFDPDFNVNLGTLLPGQSLTQSFPQVLSGNLTNTASVVGNDPLGQPHTDSDTAEVAVIAPSISLTKLVDGVQSVTGTNGQPVVYSFVVLNDGDVALTNVTLIDTDIDPAFTNVIGDLASGQSVTVEVNSVISGSLTNVADVTGEDPLGNPHDDSDDAIVLEIAPSISLTKLVDGVQSVTGTNGQPVVYSFVVLNDGDVALTNVTLIDTDIAPAFTNVIGDLASGQSVTVEVNSVISGALTNVADVTGEDPLGNPHDDSDDAIVLLINPGLNLAKTVSADGTFASSGELVTGTNNQPVTYFFVVSNDGDVALTNVTVVDTDIVPNLNTNVGDLAVGQSVTVSVADVISAQLTNTATATGFDPLGNPQTDDDPAEVALIAPSISLTKLVDGVQSVTGTNGQPVVYSFVVLNDGDVALTNVTLIDTDITPAFTNVIGDLASGQSVTVEVNSVISGSLTNVADVTGEDPLGNPHDDSDDAIVLEIAPSISLTKLVDGVQSVTGTNGQPVVYSFVVLNDGDVALTNVTLIDTDIAPAFTNVIGDLASGQSVTVEVNSVISGSLTNVADVTGEDPLGNPHTDDDTAEVALINPAINIVKTVSADGTYDSSVKTLTGTNGQAVTYFFVVSNPGDVTLTNVVVLDGDITPSFSNNVGTLLAGQSVTVSAASAISGSLTNSVFTRGYDPVGRPHTDFDVAIVLEIAPSITLTKLVDGVQSVTGTNNQPVVYSFVVLNDGDVALTNVTLIDTDIDPAFTNVIGDLASGQSVTVEVNSVISGALTNVADVTGEDPLGNPHDDSDDAIVLEIAPSISLTKLVDGVQSVTGTNGQPVVYSFVVLNDGDVALTNVTLIDTDIAPAFTNVIGDLASGQSVTVEVNSVISGSLTNVADVTGEDPLGNPHDDSDDAIVLEIAPSISLTKLVDGVQSVTGTNGQPVVYSFVVLNDGDVALTNVTLIDTDIDPAFTNVIGDLASGQSVTVEVNSVISGALTNVADVTGEDPLGNPHDDTDDAIVLLINPGLNLAKTVSADGTFASSGELVTGTNNQPVTYFFVVSNDGDVALTNVTVVDTDIVPNLNTNVGDLAVGQSVTVSVADVISAPLTNTATATGFDPLGNPQTDDDPAEVALIAPSISLTKLVDGVQSVTGTNGQPVVYSFVVLNDGDVALTNVTLIDIDITPAFTNVIGDLASGQSVTVEVNSVISGSLTNVADVTGEDPLGNPHDDSDDAIVLEIAPSISLTKLVDGVQSVTGTNGQPVVYSFVVLNDGDVALTNVTLIDTDIAPAFTNVIGDLAVGQSVTVEVASTISGSLTNVADVTGEDPLGNPHDDSDDAIVLEIAPSISLTKLVDGVQSVTGTNGQPVVYSFVVLNDGDVALTNVTLIDTDIDPAFTNVIGDLASGQSVTVEVNSVISSDLTNIATVTGQDPVGNTHDDDDDAVVLQVMFIAGSVFLDVNADGVFDPEDTNGISAAVITLFDASSNVLGVVTTQTDGAYIFTGLPPGEYTVVETDPPGYYSTADIVPPNDNRIPVTLVSGTDSTGNDFLDAQDARPQLRKVFIAASEPDLSGNFSAVYRIEVDNAADSAGIYNLIDTPAPDTNVTVNGAVVSGYTNLVFNNAGPYLLATNEPIAARATNVYVLTLDLTLSAQVMNGFTNVSLCGGTNGIFEAGEGLFNEATASGFSGTNFVSITTNDCGDVPPVILIDKTFVSASPADSNGNFVVTYNVTVENAGGTAGSYDLSDLPGPDTNVTILGGSVSGYATQVLVGAGAYTLATDEPIAAGATHTYVLALDARLSAAVMSGAAFVSECGSGGGAAVSGEGLFNEATVTFGTNDLTITTNDCGNIPPVLTIRKDFVSASEADASGLFEIRYDLVVENSGGTPEIYDLSDLPSPDINVTILGGAVTGYTNLTLSGVGPYTLATDEPIDSGATHTYSLILTGQLSSAVLDGTVSVSLCGEAAQVPQAGEGLYNLATLAVGTNNTEITDDACGDVPPVITIDKVFVSASEPDLGGAFVVTYDVTVRNSGGSSSLYDLSDTPSPDTNVTILGGSVGGYTNLVLTNGGPYSLASDEPIGAGATHTYTLSLDAQLSAAVLSGASSVSLCGSGQQGSQAGEGLFNEATVVYGTNDTSFTTNDCGNVPPVILVDKTFVSASEPDLGGAFAVTYEVTVENVGGSSGSYDLTDTPAPDLNVTILGGSVGGYTNLVLTNAGPYSLASGEPIAAGATHTYVLTLDAQLGTGVLLGLTNVSECVSVTGGFQANAGLFNEVVLVYGTNDLTVTTNTCGEIPPVISIDKTFVSASEPDLGGAFAVTYDVTVRNTGGSAGLYDLSDTPSPDTNVTIVGGAVSGYTNLVLTNAGPYTLATDEPIGVGGVHTYTLTLDAQLSAAVLSGSSSVSLCGSGQQGSQAGEGLFNEATVRFGTNDLTITTNDCGDVPPVILIDKTFVSASPADSNGNFVVTYNVTVENAGGTAGSYDLSDLPGPDTNVTILGGSVSGYATQVLVGAGAYILATDEPIAAGATHTYVLALDARLSMAVMSGAAFVSECGAGGGAAVSGEGLFNEATVTFGTNNLTITTNDCGNIPPVLTIRKDFVSASEADASGLFEIRYDLVVENSGGTPEIYDLSDLPSPDTNVTILGGAVTGYTNLTLSGVGPYTLATDEPIDSGATHTYSLILTGQLSSAVLDGTVSVSLCGETAQVPQAGEGLYNLATLAVGTNNTEITDDACGDVPPVILIDKTFVSASEASASGTFTATYVVVVWNTGGQDGLYDLTDTPDPDANVLVNGAAVSGQTNLSLAGAGPYTLATDVLLAAGASHVYTVRLDLALSPAILSGATQVTACAEGEVGFEAGSGLYNEATVVYGTNNTTVTDEDCGEVPPYLLIDKTFVDTTDLDGLGNFQVTYIVEVENVGGCGGVYDLTDTPDPDANVTILGGAVSGYTNLVLVGPGPYVFATNEPICIGETHVYTARLNAVLSPAAMAGSATVTVCGAAQQIPVAGEGLYNEATVTFGDSRTSLTTNDCGNLPPIPRFDIVKTRISPTNRPALLGEEIVFTIAVENTGEVGLGVVPLADTYNTNLLGYIAALPAPDSVAIGSLGWTNLGPLAVGESVVVTARFEAVSVGSDLNVALASPVTTNGIPLVPQTSSAPHEAASGSIAGSVFYDANVDGIFDPEDITNGIAGVTVTLLDATNSVLATTTTAADGSYLFTNLAAGSYTVVETDPTNFFSTADVVPPNDNRIPVTLAANQNSTGNDFLDGEYAVIGDRVWLDVGNPPNGIQDPSEANSVLPGNRSVILTLFDTNDQVVAVTTSSTQVGTSGLYLFTEVRPGTYYIEATRPFGFGITVGGTNAPDASPVDSDVDPLSRQTLLFTVLPGQVQTNIDVGLFGFVNLAQVSEFSGSVEGGAPTLRWTTVTEYGTAGWMLERSEDGETWTAVSDVLPSSGSLLVGAAYAWVDPTAEFRSYQYRLVEVEASGSDRVYGPYDVTFKAGRTVRAAAAPVAGSGYDWTVAEAPAAPAARVSLASAETADAVKVTVRETGFVRIPEAALAGILGLDEAVLAETPLRLTTLGIEVPMVREDGAVVFFAAAHQNLFTDANVYRIEPGDGVAPEIRDGQPSGGTPATMFTATAVFENNAILRSDLVSDPAEDPWYWLMLISGSANYGERTLTLDLPQAVPGAEGLVTVALKGASADAGRKAHRAELLVNGQSLGLVDFNGLDAVSVSLAVPAGVLTSGANSLTVRAVPPAGTAADVFYLDRVEVAYPRTTVAEDDTLVVEAEAGPVRASGFSTDDLQVWDVTDALHPVRLIGVMTGAGSVTFHAATPGRYAVRPVGLEPAPTALAGWLDSDLREAGHRVDYLVIHGDGLGAEAAALAALREVNGLAVKVVSVEEVFNTFNHGVRDPNAIHALLGYAYHTWAEAPRYVVLAGSSSLDRDDAYGYGTDLVPALRAANKYGVYASDNALADVTGDGLPDFAVGRIPARTAAQLAAYIAKVQAFEAGGTWRDRVAILNDNADRGGDYAWNAARFENLVTGRTTTRIDTDAVGASAARTAWLADLGAGYEFGLYVGHGTVLRVAEEGLLTTGDAGALANSDGAGVIGAFGCLMGAFGLPGVTGVGESLVLSEGGASAVIASGTLVYNDESTMLGEALIEAVYHKGLTRLGDAWVQARTAVILSGHAGVAGAYQILGDPALSMGSADAPRGGPSVVPGRGGYAEWLAWAFAPVWHDWNLVGGSLDNPDGDSLNNWEEYLAGTRADDAASEFVVVEVRIAGGADVTLQWPSAPGRLYRIERGSVIGGDYQTVAEGVPADGASTEWIDPDPLPGAAYYRVIVR